MAEPVAAPAATPMRLEVLNKMSDLITAAFGLVAALAWNEAIQALFTAYLGADRSALGAKVGYAVLVTVVAVLLVIYIGKAAARAKARLAK